MAALRHTYFNCLTPNGEPLRWYPPKVEGDVLVDSIYFGAVLAEMDCRLNTRPLTFYLTRDLANLPAYGAGVVAIVTGDELTRVPAYFNRVRAVFKNHAVRPLLTSSFIREPTLVNLSWFLSYVRMCAHHLPGALAYVRARFAPRAKRHLSPVWLLPIGVLNQRELPITPVADRRSDLFFAGSVSHRADASRFRNLLAPKVLSRGDMVRRVEELAARHPELSVNVTTTGAFVDSINSDSAAYSQQLMDTRVALVPRGATADTFRFWQALRYGCVVVADTLPKHHLFYDGAPVVRIRDWQDLEREVIPLLRDPELLEQLHRRSLDWWRTKGSPEAVGAYMAAKLNALNA